MRHGLVPCIVGSWGYWLARLGVANAKQHWRYLVARYGAYPVVWCLCGEVQCIYPDFAATLSQEQRERALCALRDDWSDVARYLARIFPGVCGKVLMRVSEARVNIRNNN